MNTLAGGVLGAKDEKDEDAELRALIDELGRRSYDTALGRREVPDRFDVQLGRGNSPSCCIAWPVMPARCPWPKPTLLQVGLHSTVTSTYPTGHSPWPSPTQLPKAATSA